MSAIRSKKFGQDFSWGVSSSALQTEGAWDADGKGFSNWDVFVRRKGSVHKGHTHHIATDFYNRYKNDIDLVKELNIPNFRFSLSWSRILPLGKGELNRKGIDFYKRVFERCHKKNIEPWVTLYHWDLPHELEKKGGWTNRDIVSWFGDYVQLCAKHFGDLAKHWMVLNEPMGFTGSGYYLGHHAPGKKGLKNFLPAAHHAVLCQAAGSRILKRELKKAEVGSTFSCSYVTPWSLATADVKAAKRIDALLNRMFIEPALGLGYPAEDLPVLKKMEKYYKPGDENRLKADFDFIGIQNYTREVIKHSLLVPHLNANVVPASKRKVFRTQMNWEVYPEAIYEMIKKFSAYKKVKKIIVTENGAAFADKVEVGRVRDEQRIDFLSGYLQQVLRAKKEGLKINGYFVWSLTDNFEWAEGYHPRFGLVHVDFETQERTIKDSGYWYRNFLRG